LKQEESQSASVGFTAKIPAAKLTLTADAYIVNQRQSSSYGSDQVELLLLELLLLN
jgi:hypothetical protein